MSYIDSLLSTGKLQGPVEMFQISAYVHLEDDLVRKSVIFPNAKSSVKSINGTGSGRYVSEFQLILEDDLTKLSSLSKF